MLYLDQNQIMQTLTLNETMDSVEQALRLYEQGQFVMPDRQTINAGEGNVFILMPCVAAGSMTAKILTLFPGNRAIDRPMIDGLCYSPTSQAARSSAWPTPKRSRP